MAHWYPADHVKGGGCNCSKCTSRRAYQSKGIEILKSPTLSLIERAYAETEADRYTDEYLERNIQRGFTRKKSSAKR